MGGAGSEGFQEVGTVGQGTFRQVGHPGSGCLRGRDAARPPLPPPLLPLPAPAPRAASRAVLGQVQPVLGSAALPPGMDSSFLFRFHFT